MTDKITVRYLKGYNNQIFHHSDKRGYLINNIIRPKLQQLPDDKKFKNYHNVYHHCHSVYEIALMLATYHLVLGKQNKLAKPYDNLLYIAAMLHDVNHTQIKGDDQVNIDRAVAFVNECFDEFEQRKLETPAIDDNNPATLDSQSEIYQNRELIIKMIQLTKYPSTVNPEVLTEFEEKCGHIPTVLLKCLLDADMLYACMYRDPEIILVDLANEILDPGLSSLEKMNLMLNNQKVFIEKQKDKMHTKFGEELFIKNSAAYLKQMETYIAEDS